MKILVPISKVPDTTSKISFVDGDTRFNTDGVQMIMNPTDEWYALVKAIELKEKNGGEVVVIHVGAADSEQIIRKALAIGADRAVRVDVEPTDGFYTASQIADFAKSENFDLIITGKETIDFNSFEIAGMVAELLDWPAAALVNALDVNGNTAVYNREIEGGTETVECSLPLVIGATKDLAQPRIPNMKGIMAARTKALAVVPANGAQPRVTVTRFSLPDKNKQCKYVDKDNIEELVRLLHQEAKVI